MNEPIKIVLIDDHRVICDGITSYFMHEENVSVVGIFQRSSDFLVWFEANHALFDILILDQNIDQLSGLEIAAQVKSKAPYVKVIILSLEHKEATVKKALKMGVAGYILKSSPIQEIHRAVLQVKNGQNYFSKEISEIVINSYRNDGEEKQGNLTKREVEIIKLILGEKSNIEIADALHISPRTVDTHKRNILEKTGSKNIVGLVKYCLENNLIEH